MYRIGKTIGQYDTSIAGWSFAIASALETYGIDASEVFFNVGIELAQIATPHERLPVSLVEQVWQYAASETDGSFGIRVAQQLTPASLQALGLLLFCSETPQRLFERYIRYRCVLSHRHFCEMVVKGKEVHVDLVDERERRSEITNDAAAGFLHKVLQLAGAGENIVKELHVTRILGSERKDMEQFFGAPVKENQPRYSLVFDAKDLNMKLPAGDSALASQLEASVERYIADNGLISEYMLLVRTEILRRMDSGALSLDAVAASLNVTPRTLQRRLSDEGSSYNALIDQVRCQIALDYCESSTISATEIAFKLGFADSSSFGRRFRQWTGMSFSECRSRKPIR